MPLDEDILEGFQQGLPGPSFLSMELHPLFNPVILHNLFQVCPHELLATCRQVCKAWLQESLLIWRSSSTPTLRRSLLDKGIHMGRKEKVVPAGREPSTNDSFLEFLDWYEQECGVKRYRNFDLEDWHIGLDRGEGPASTGTSGSGPSSIQPQQDRFWHLVGDNITSLKLRDCSFRDLPTFRRIIFQICPNMRSLTLYECRLVDPIEKLESPPTQYIEPICGERLKLRSLSVSSINNVPISQLELLSHFPSLTHLKLGLDTDYDFDEVLRYWLHAIKVIRQQDDSKLPLKKFEVVCLEGLPLTDEKAPAKYRELWGLLQELNLPLESFDIEDPCGVDVIKDCLSMMGKTVRRITAVEDKLAVQYLENGGHYPHRPVDPFLSNFPFGMELDKLQTLVISTGFCENMEFLKWTPNLERLQLSVMVFRIAIPPKSTTIVTNTCETSMANVRLLKLKELWMGDIVSEEDVRRFCRWMPNVEILTMVLTDENFPIICEHWKDLTHLHQVDGAGLHDKGVTGGMRRGGGRGAATPPNITMLKRLRCFQYAGTTKTCNLTTASVYNGFAKLPDLQILDIRPLSFREHLSATAFKVLRRQIPVIRVGEDRRHRSNPGRGSTKAAPVQKFECRYFKDDIGNECEFEMERG